MRYNLCPRLRGPERILLGSRDAGFFTSSGVLSFRHPSSLSATFLVLRVILKHFHKKVQYLLIIPKGR
jgi:hypothetical protein